MKILWLTNKVIPAVSAARGEAATLVNEGWLSKMFKQLCDEPNVEMNIVCCEGGKRDSGTAKNFSWFTVEEGRASETSYDEKQKIVFESIIKKVNPDVIHAWGSEYPHTYAMTQAAKACGVIEKMVVSLQGLISFYSYYYYYYCNLSDKTVKSHTFYDLVRKTNVVEQERVFAERGRWEIAALKELYHVIGRTDWDRHCALAHNPSLNYHFCNETLRDAFYTGEWSYGECKKHSIFISQATYSIKGFHLLLEALPSVIQAYPDTQVYVAGADIRGTGSFMSRLKRTSYGNYLRKLIKKKKLSSHITFLGPLDAEKMKEQYLNSNAFVCSSSVENSPNSVGEAMLLGVPVVCSDVGGVRSVFNAPEEGWTYRWDDTEALARAIIELFGNPDEAARRATNARNHAQKTHNSEVNYKTLCDIYSKIGGHRI